MIAMPVEQQGRFACPVCSHRFWTLHDKKRHLRADHGKKPKEVSP